MGEYIVDDRFEGIDFIGAEEAKLAKRCLECILSPGVTDEQAMKVWMHICESKVISKEKFEKMSVSQKRRMMSEIEVNDFVGYCEGV